MQHKLFFDFEFDPITKKAISCGLVGNFKANGAPVTLYYEFNIDANKIKSSFVQDTIVPLLGLPEGQSRIDQGNFGSVLNEDVAELCQLAGIPSSSITLVCDSDFDAKLIKELAGEAFTVEQVDFQDFDESHDFEEAYSDYFDAISNPRHHALSDAKALMHAYGVIMTSRKATQSNIEPKPRAAQLG